MGKGMGGAAYKSSGAVAPLTYKDIAVIPKGMGGAACKSSGAVAPLTYKDIAVILCCSIVNLSTAYNVSIPFPIVPLYTNELKIDDLTAGAILGATSLSYMLASPYFGWLLYNSACRPFILGGLLLTTLGNIIFVSTSSPLVFICARTTIGIGNAMAEIAAMTWTSRNYPDHMGKIMSAFEVFQGIGWMVGPSTAGYFYEHWGSAKGFPASFIIGAVGSMGIMCYAFAILPPDKTIRKDDGIEAGANVWVMLTSPALVVTSVVLFTFSVGMNSLFATVTENTGRGAHAGGTLITLTSIMYIIIGPMAGYICDHYENRYNRLMLTMGCGGAAVLLCILGPSPLLTPLQGSLMSSSVELQMATTETVVMPDVSEVATPGPRNYWTMAVLMALLGISEALVVSPAYPEMLRHCRINVASAAGPLSALFSGLWSAGEAVGPAVGMKIVALYGFPWGATMISIAVGICAFVIRFHPFGDNSSDKLIPLDDAMPLGRNHNVLQDLKRIIGIWRLHFEVQLKALGLFKGGPTPVSHKGGPTPVSQWHVLKQDSRPIEDEDKDSL